MLEPIPNNPIVNAGLLYVNGLSISNTAADVKTLFLDKGAARDSTNIQDIILPSLITMDGSKVGPNGVDIAPLVANRFYAVYVIGDSTNYKPTAGLFSLAALTPTLPFGYDMFRRVGWVLTDSSAHILIFWQYGKSSERSYYYDVGITALTGGSSTNFATINLSASVPPISTEALFQVTYTPSGAANFASFITFGSASPSSLIATFGYGVAAAQKGMITLPAHTDGSNVPFVLYKVVAGDTLTLLTAGYKDYLI